MSHIAESILLVDGHTHAEIAREIPAPDATGHVTGQVIAQEIRNASALTADGIVSAVEDNGRWRLARGGESGRAVYVL